MIDPEQLRAAFHKAHTDLLNQRTADGHWEGELSSSALSTATAISALTVAHRSAQATNSSGTSGGDTLLVENGLRWLIAHQNPDGGWGDTDKSHTNIATTLLAVAAIHLADQTTRFAQSLDRAMKVVDRAGALDALRRRYGKDKTFAVPILTNYALAGLVDWSEVPALPFELAVVPQRFYRWVRLPVVSYAIPALVAIGQARHMHQPPRFPGIRWLRHCLIRPSLRVLDRMQPESGGYLEAIPLTSFVVMSLAGTGRLAHAVTQRGLKFLRNTARADGSWPIDVNLATWNTSLAVRALSQGGCNIAAKADLDWFLNCQTAVRHPFTGAAPGGWGWTDLSGSVPDADDTSSALLALRQWHRADSCCDRDRRRIEDAVERGVRWLLDLQNSDGGWPTFCRGWGKLPFDRSGADLTAHAMRALQIWKQTSPRRVKRAVQRGWSFLERQQRPDGSWIPLWFGNQDHPDEENPVFGTSRVLLAFEELGRAETQFAQRGYEYLAAVQCPDGSWNGAGATGNLPQSSEGSVEETALVVEALQGANNDSGVQIALAKGLRWLIEAVFADRHMENAPIGFYFAKLWYYERLYPLTFTVAALGRATRRKSPPNK